MSVAAVLSLIGGLVALVTKLLPEKKTPLPKAETVKPVPVKREMDPFEVKRHR